MTPTNTGTETKIPSWKDTIPFKPKIKECYVIHSFLLFKQVQVEYPSWQYPTPYKYNN